MTDPTPPIRGDEGEAGDVCPDCGGTWDEAQRPGCKRPWHHAEEWAWLAGDGQANDCTHGSATGVDTTPVTDPGKVWRCDHCGLRWTSAPSDAEDGRCGDVRPSGPNDNAATWIPCQLDAGHDGPHNSTSGCRGGSMEWPNVSDAEDATPAGAGGAEEVEAAIRRIEESRQSHAEWADHMLTCEHCKENGPPPHIQTRDEHLQIVAEYDAVLSLLRGLARHVAQRERAAAVGAWDEGWNAAVDSDGYPGDRNPYRLAAGGK